MAGPDNQVEAGFPHLAARIQHDLYRVAHGLDREHPWPDVIHIGYNASAKSYANRGLGYATWRDHYFDVALGEARAIKSAADVAKWMGVKVLLSLGAGSPTAQPIQECMNKAFETVTLLLYFVLGATDPFVDYSGRVVSLGSSSVDSALVMDPSTNALWQTDGVHVSCDRARFEPGTAYSNDNCIRVTRESQRRSTVGAWRVAKTVLKAYQYF